jgi:hypothetical protein
MFEAGVSIVDIHKSSEINVRLEQPFEEAVDEVLTLQR